jgi:DNA-binding transcriptional ArsR family regulator
MTAAGRDDDHTHEPATDETKTWTDTTVVDALFGVVSNRDNRCLLAYLDGLDGRIASETELVERLVEVREGTDEETRPSALDAVVHHVCLPRLEAAGLVRFDGERGVVEYLNPPWFQAVLERHRELLFADVDAPATCDVDRDVLDGLLAEPRRRRALAQLRLWDQPVTLADLADEVAVHERGRPITEISADAVLEVYLSLYRTHLRPLVDAGLVVYDEEADVVAPEPNAAALDSFLGIAPE